MPDDLTSQGIAALSGRKAAGTSFALDNFSGYPLKLSMLRGQAVLVNLWATWWGHIVWRLTTISNTAA